MAQNRQTQTGTSQPRTTTTPGSAHGPEGGGPNAGMQPQPHQQQSKGVQKATEATERVAERAQSTFENAKERVREQLGAVSRAFTRATEQLDQDQQSALSRRVRQYVQKTDNASRYIQDKSPREMKDDLESLARQRPAWVLGGAFLLGLLGARFLKSSERRGTTSGGMKGAVGYGTA